jgi:hypothetical protein
LEKIRLKSHLNDHHHHHHHTNHGSTTISSSNNIDLISGGETSSLSRNSDLEGSCQNDTLLLVETKKSNIQNYTVSSTNESAANLPHKHQGNNKSRSKSHHVRRAHHSRKQKQQTTLECDSENASSSEIISFEVLNQNKAANSKSKSKSNSNRNNSNNKNNLEKIELEKTKHSTSKPATLLTTTSTSSTTSSSASSTCQLIPLKLNNPQNTVNESHVVLESLIQPSAPPCPQINTPAPPVPTLPPPKLPNLVASLNTAANSLTNPSPSLVVSNVILNTSAASGNNITKNISKIKNHNRMSGKDKEASASADDRFRHFYQVRRNNGDVLSQDFMNNIQNKLSSSNNLNNSNLTLNPMESNQGSASRSASLNSKENNSKRKKAAKKL